MMFVSLLLVYPVLLASAVDRVPAERMPADRLVTYPPPIIQVRTRRFPLAPPPPPALPAPPLDLAIVATPKLAAFYPAAALKRGEQGFSKLRLEIDAAGRVVGCTTPAAVAPTPLDRAACALGTALRFRAPPPGMAGVLPLGVRFTGKTVKIVRAAAAIPAVRDASVPFVTEQDYPPVALRQGAEGRVVAMVSVSTSGVAEACTIISQSNSIDLDDATCRVSNRARYVPGRDGFGDPEAGTVSLPIVWLLPG